MCIGGSGGTPGIRPVAQPPKAEDGSPKSAAKPVLKKVAARKVQRGPRYDELNLKPGLGGSGLFEQRGDNASNGRGNGGSVGGGGGFGGDNGHGPGGGGGGGFG